MRSKVYIKCLPEAEVLWDLFEYDVFKGVLYWKKELAKNQQSGQIAGTIQTKGYRTIKIDGVNYRAHRLIYKFCTGKEPSTVVEHRDGNPLNNCFHNLHSSDQRRNNGTTSEHSHKTTPPGVRPVVRAGKTQYESRIKINYRLYTIGFFDTPEEAGDAYQDAIRRYEQDPKWRPVKPIFQPRQTLKYAYKRSERKWLSYIWLRGKQHFCGVFQTEFEAHIAALAYKLEHLWITPPNEFPEPSTNN